MSDVSRRRRIAGRLLLGAAAVALPLTASISYAQAEGSAVQEVELAPSVPAAPAAPAAPVAPGALAAPDAPEAPQAPEAPEVRKEVRVFTLRREGDAPLPEGDLRRFEFRSDRELTLEQQKHFEEMAREWEKKGAEFAERAKEFEKMAPRLEALAKDHERMAFAFAARAPRVVESCDEGSEGRRESVDENGRRTIVICSRRIERDARLGAMSGLRSARAAIAGNREIAAEVRNEILRELDEEIARIESGK